MCCHLSTCLLYNPFHEQFRISFGNNYVHVKFWCRNKLNDFARNNLPRSLSQDATTLAHVVQYGVSIDIDTNHGTP